MPQSPDVVLHAAFLAPVCGADVSVIASVCRSGVSDTHPGPTFGGIESSKPALTSRFGPTGPEPMPVVTPALSNTALLSMARSWLVTASPPNVMPDWFIEAIATVTEPTGVHDV